MLTFSDYLLSAISVGKVERVFSLVLPEVGRRVYGRHCSPNASLIGFAAWWGGGGMVKGWGYLTQALIFVWDGALWRWFIAVAGFEVLAYFRGS